MAAPLRITPSTIAAVHAGRLDANQAAELAEMLANALADPQAAAAALGLELEHSRAEMLARDAARAAVIRAAAQSLSAAMSDRGKAKMISSAFLRYHGDGRLRDADVAECPARLKGLERFAWQAFRLFDNKLGLSAENIRKIVGRRRCR
jgi:GAF domain-containing protein